jgi:hypothetical protein
MPTGNDEDAVARSDFVRVQPEVVGARLWVERREFHIQGCNESCRDVAR